MSETIQGIINNTVGITGFCLYVAAVVAAATLPLWGYKLVEAKLAGKHKALRVTRKDKLSGFRTTSIIASLGTTTAGVFLIQMLPLVFSIINDVGSDFAVPIVYGDHLGQSLPSDYIESFYGVTAQLGDMLQTAAPMAAVGLGGYNLINNLSRGLPAIKHG